MTLYTTRIGIGWSRREDWESRLVMRFDRLKYSDGKMHRSPFSHVFLVFEFAGGLRIVRESTGRRGVTMTPWSVLVNDPSITALYVSWFCLSSTQIEEAWNYADSLWGASYDFKHLIGLFAWITLCGRNLKEQPWWLRFALDNRYICSEFSDAVCAHIGIDINGAWATPATSTPHSQLMAVAGCVEGCSTEVIRRMEKKTTLDVQCDIAPRLLP